MFFKAVHELDAQNPGAENITVAQIDYHDVFSACHIETLEKGHFRRKKSIVEGSHNYIYGKKWHKKVIHRHARINSVAKDKQITSQTKPM
jgi:hypothetical protein